MISPEDIPKSVEQPRQGGIDARPEHSADESGPYGKDVDLIIESAGDLNAAQLKTRLSENFVTPLVADAFNGGIRETIITRADGKRAIQEMLLSPAMLIDKIAFAVEGVELKLPQEEFAGFLPATNGIRETVLKILADKHLVGPMKDVLSEARLDLEDKKRQADAARAVIAGHPHETLSGADHLKLLHDASEDLGEKGTEEVIKGPDTETNPYDDLLYGDSVGTVEDAAVRPDVSDVDELSRRRREEDARHNASNAYKRPEME